MTSAAPNVAELVVFTWNVDMNIDAVKLAFDHLEQHVARGAHIVAAFQEAPDDFAAALKPGGRLKLRTTGLRSERCNVVVTSDGVDLDSNGDRHEDAPLIDEGRRCEGLTLATADWDGLRFLAVHGWDRAFYPLETQRADWRHLVRGVLEAFWSKGPLIVAGDLNANPWDHEVTYRNGWFASRPAERWLRSKYKLPGREVRGTPLVNLMWPLVGARQTPGTYCFDSASDVTWHCLDQIIVSRGLADDRVVARILSSVAGKALIDESGEPASSEAVKGKLVHVFSDHLPVEAVIPGAVLVTACKNARKNRDG